MPQRSKREEIAAAAVDRFHSHGYNATSVRDITDTAGAPVGSFYNHFATKEDLALEAVRRYAESGNGYLADRSLPPLERLRRHFACIQDENIERGFTRGCMLGNFTAEVVDHNPAIRDAVRHSFASWTKAITAVLTEARDDGSLRPGLEPLATARFLLTAWEGALIESRAYQSPDAFDNFFAMVFDVLLPAPVTD